MRKLLLTGAVLLGGVVAVAGCHPVEFHGHNHNANWLMGHRDWDHHDDTPVTVAATLNCPEQEGDLTRTSMAADGSSCQYHGDDDQDVTLTRLALNGQTPQAALAPMKADLQGLVPVRSGSSPVNVEASNDGDHDHDNAKIDLPGIHIDAHGNQAKLKILGMDINADGDNADIHTNMGMKGTVIHAGPGGAEIQADNVGQHAAELVYILAGDNAGPSGYRAVGYIARGPVAGPLVVGEFKTKDHDHNGHDHDLDRLIDLNVTPAS
jgi:hypothetical protein